MECEDVILAIAERDRRMLTGFEETRLFEHIEGCEGCRVLYDESDEDWRVLAKIPEDALAERDLLVLPMVDPVVFHLRSQIAAGGMGRIARAYDRRLGREVAIKEVLDSSMHGRFEREAMITSRLQHPAIVPIYEAGVWPDGTPFYTMRLVEGGTLARSIETARSPAERLALVPHVVAVTEALAYAHARGVIHRDLKPSNVLVGPFGETVVIDWGLAKELSDATPEDAGALSSHADRTQIGSVMGTPGFMAPEQARGEAIDERGDVYALGAILYNLLAGSPPFRDQLGDAGADALIAAIKTRPPTPIDELAPEAPADLRAVVRRAMAHDATERYRNAGDMAAELRRFQSGQLLRSREYTFGELAMRWIRRHRTAVTVGSIGLVALAVVAIVSFVNVTRSRAAERDARHAAEANLVLSRDGAAALLEEQARLELLVGDHERALAYASEAVVSGRDTPVVRFILAAAARDLDLARATIRRPQLTASCGRLRNCAATDVFALAYTPANELVVVEATGRLTTWRDGVRTRNIALGAEADTARFDDAGKRVAIVTGNRLTVWDVAAGTERWHVDEPDLFAATIVFDPQGSRLAVVVDDENTRRVTVRDVDTGKPLGAIELGGTQITAVAFSPDGARLAACGKDGTVRVYATTMAPIATWTVGEDPTLIAFVDGDLVVVDGDDHGLAIWRSSTRKLVAALPGHSGPYVAVQRSPDGRYLATGDSSTVRLYTAGGELVAESGDPDGRIDTLAFVGDALVGAGLDNRFFVWDLPTLRTRSVIDHLDYVEVLTVSADGTRIATAASERVVHEWAMPHGQRIAHVEASVSRLDGERWLTTTEDGLVVRDVRTGAQRAVVRGVGKSLDGVTRDIVSTGDDVDTLHDLATGQVVGTLSLLGTASQLSRGEHYVLDAEDEYKKPALVRVYDAGDLHLVRELTAEESGYLATSPTDDRLVVGTTNTLAQYALPSGELLWSTALPRRRDGATVTPAYDPTGTWIIVTDAGATCWIFETASGRLAATFVLDQDIVDVMFAPDGERVLLQTATRFELWSTRAGTLERTVERGSTATAAFGPDGARLATASKDGSVRLWDTASGRLLANIHAHRDEIRHLELTATRLLVVAPGAASLWNVESDTRDRAAIAAAAAKLPWRVENGTLVARPR